MSKGTIRRLFEHRGFGFIQTESGRDIFFHRSDILHIPFEALQVGQAVKFTVVATLQGPKARRVCVIEADTTSREPGQ